MRKVVGGDEPSSDSGGLDLGLGEGEGPGQVGIRRHSIVAVSAESSELGPLSPASRVDKAGWDPVCSSRSSLSVHTCLIML